MLLTDIPNDVLLDILRLTDQINLRKVCTKFRDLIDNNIIYDIGIADIIPKNKPAKCFRIFAQYSDESIDKLIASKWEIVRDVYSLALPSCENLKDVSMLGNIYDLNLSNCQNIKDVSKLGNVHTLNLSCCPNIKDVSMLGNVHSLNLSCCENLKDVSKLRNVHDLDLSNTLVEDVSKLENVCHLDISFTYVTDISMLKKFKSINLRGMDNFTQEDIANLPKGAIAYPQTYPIDGEPYWTPY